ncbi:MAG: polysaccharide pyruvyl transferase family protein [Chloroflexota bacterium]
MNILFLGTHGQYNIGDELLLETFLSNLGPDNHYTVNSYDPPFTRDMLSGRFNLQTFHTTRQLPFFLRCLLTSDLLFFGGGSIIKELYASVGRNPYATLRMILATVTFAKRVTGKTVIMSNVGVGPIATPGGERLARAILKQVDFISVRDQRSFELCQKLGLQPQRLRRVPDAVFANAPAALLAETPAQPPERQPGEPLRLALNLNYDIENRAAWEGFLNGLAGALQRLQANQPLELHALPMQSRFKANDDLSVLQGFQERIPGIPMTLHSPETAQQAAAIIAGCDAVLAERLHTLVIAAILGRPFYGLVYDVKVAELVDYLGMGEHSLNINRPFETEALYLGLCGMLQQRQLLAGQLLQRSTALRSELTAYFDQLRAEYLHPTQQR